MKQTTPRAALALILAAAALGLAHPATAQPTSPEALDDTTQLFCKDATGEIQPMKYASLGTVVRRYAERFSFTLSIDPGMKAMKFSNATTPFFISYVIQPYRDDAGHTGLALLSMHMSLENFDEELKGNDMCYFTQFGK